MVREETEEIEGRLTQDPEGPDVRAPREGRIEDHSKEFHLHYNGEMLILKEEGRLR